MARSVAEHLVEIMVQAGIQNVYGMVGDSANPVVDAIRRADGKLDLHSGPQRGGRRLRRGRRGHDHRSPDRGAGVVRARQLASPQRAV